MAAGELARSLGLPGPVARVLCHRGLTSEPAARRFLEPGAAQLLPPKGLPDIDIAARRLATAVAAGERIAVCGDYDVDGMTGTALLVRFFKMLEADVVWAIPDRDIDGYGLAPRMVDVLAGQGARVLITVDNGVNAHDALARAQREGVDVIVTDHHLPGGELPPALALVNPHLDEGATADMRRLCGCALAFKLAWAVADRSRAHMGPEGPHRFKQFLRDALALVALATLADQMPLRGENRVIVSMGLASLRRSPHAGLQALRDVAKVGKQAITSEDVAFKVAPRINAAGRLGEPETVVNLLVCEEPVEANQLARRLESLNRERRQIEQGVLEEALVQAEALVAAGNCAALVVAGSGWHAGVIGIVAARLVDRFGRPSVVIGLGGAGGEGAAEKGRGSCRTPEGFDLVAGLEAAQAHLLKFGGHKMAAGLEIEAAALPAFRAAFEAAIHVQANNKPAKADRVFDARADVDTWTQPAVEALARLEPFGRDNPQPVFLLSGVEVAGTPKLMGQPARHLAFTVRQSRGAIRVIGWRRHDLYDLVASGGALDLAVTPCLNTWRGITSAELRLVDARPAAPVAPEDCA